MFAFDDARAALQFDYRTLMLNWVVDAEQTYAELAVNSAAMWDKYAEAPPEDPNEPWGRWHADAARALEWLRSAEVGAKPVRLICETQLLLRPYLEGRMKMHLLYKVVRAESENHLYNDFGFGRLPHFSVNFILGRKGKFSPKGTGCLLFDRGRLTMSAFGCETKQLHSPKWTSIAYDAGV